MAAKSGPLLLTTPDRARPRRGDRDHSSPSRREARCSSSADRRPRSLHRYRRPRCRRLRGPTPLRPRPVRHRGRRRRSDRQPDDDGPEATGLDFPDGLAAGAAAVPRRSGRLLGPRTGRHRRRRRRCTSGRPSRPRLRRRRAGPQADPTATPIVGSDRYATAAAVATPLGPAGRPEHLRRLRIRCPFPDALAPAAPTSPATAWPAAARAARRSAPPSLASYLGTLPEVSDRDCSTAGRPPSETPSAPRSGASRRAPVARHGSIFPSPPGRVTARPGTRPSS